jgi:predicted ATPase
MLGLENTESERPWSDEGNYRNVCIGWSLDQDSNPGSTDHKVGMLLDRAILRIPVV